MSSDIGDWYRGIPQISRYWFTGSVALPLLGKVGVVTPIQMIMNLQLVLYKFHFWRPFTALFYYPITPMTGFHYLMNLYFLYSYSTQLETSFYEGNTLTVYSQTRIRETHRAVRKEFLLSTVSFISCPINVESLSCMKVKE